MRCPFCSSMQTSVVDSRPVSPGDQIRRRRQCAECGERFTTYEAAELNYPRIIKSDGRREPFMEDKIRAGLLRALEKRPVKSAAIETVIADVKHRLRALGEREIGSGKVGDLIMCMLRGLDQVAYIRFASVYRSYEDVDAFLAEIEQLEGDLPPLLRQAQLELLADEST